MGIVCRITGICSRSRKEKILIAYFKDPQRENATNFAVGGAVSTDLLTSEAAGLPAQIPTYLMAATEFPFRWF